VSRRHPCRWCGEKHLSFQECGPTPPSNDPDSLHVFIPNSKGLWKVGKFDQYVNRPWYAHDRGRWFGPGQAGRTFATWEEAFAYADRKARE
jgi:hypothetical protein